MSGAGRCRLVCLLALVSLASAADGWAFWTAAGAGSGAVSSGSLVAATLTTPASATNSITVTWAQQADAGTVIAVQQLDRVLRRAPARQRLLRRRVGRRLWR